MHGPDMLNLIVSDIVEHIQQVVTGRSAQGGIRTTAGLQLVKLHAAANRATQQQLVPLELQVHVDMLISCIMMGAH